MGSPHLSPGAVRSSSENSKQTPPGGRRQAAHGDPIHQRKSPGCNRHSTNLLGPTVGRASGYEAGRCRGWQRRPQVKKGENGGTVSGIVTGDSAWDPRRLYTLEVRMKHGIYEPVTEAASA